MGHMDLYHHMDLSDLMDYYHHMDLLDLMDLFHHMDLLDLMDMEDLMAQSQECHLNQKKDQSL